MLRQVFRSCSTSATRQTKPTVTLFTKPDCTLCVPVKFIIRKTQHANDFDYQEVNIDDEEQKEWFDLYKYDIPVVHIDGVEVARHRMEEAVFRQILERAISTSSAK